MVHFSRSKYRLLFQIVCFYALCSPAAWSQVVVDTLPPSGLRVDSTYAFRDSAVVDLSRQVRISGDGLDEIIDYGAKDSMWFDVTNKQLHLYGEAFVKYTSLNVKAGYILMDYGKNEISASPLADTTGQLAGLPEFEDRDQKFTATRLRYNFKSKKGIIYETRSKQEDLYVLGEKAKFVGSASTDTSGKTRNTIYNQNALLTTCDADHPHFGIRARKLKVIPDKLVVTGLSLLEIGGVPTPLVLPFGFYPITKTRKAGLLIPRDFDFRSTLGVGIENFGWYQPINNYMDAKLLFRAYTGGTLGATGELRYNRRYQYQGNFSLRMNQVKTENEYAEKLKAQSFGLTWTHNQDSKSHPTRKFGGSVNIETNRDQNRNRNDYQSVYQNQLRSNLTFSKIYPGKPYSFTAAFQHDQNVNTRQMNVTLPSMTFQMQQIFPLKRKVQIGQERWYEKIALSYNSKLQNSFRTVDTLLFKRQTLENAQMGIQHNVNTNVALKVFKYINISPRLEYEENWYPYTTRKELLDENRLVYRDIKDPETGEVLGKEIDTLKSQFGIDTTYRLWGFNAFRRYNAGISMNTILFYTKQFKKGWFRGIRHKMSPSVSTGFGPDFTQPRYNYFRTVETDTRPLFNDTLTYGIFDDNVFGRPSNSPRQLGIGWGVVNLLEIKYRGRRDTADRKVRIFDNLAFSGNYSITADSLKWSTVSTGGLFRLFKGITNIQWNVTFDPYIADARGGRINRYMIREKGRLVRTTGLQVALNNNFTINQIGQIFSRKKVEQNDNLTRPTAAGATDKFSNWFDNWGVTHRIELVRRLIPTGIGEARDTFLVTNHSLGVTGNLQLNSKWNLRLGNIAYDFPTKRLVYPDLGLVRDLHCWELSLSWQPERGTYLFSINVKPGTLDFLKVPYRKNNFD